jgi:GR25 family glycosyltransferase involved in LPS biosynthesis
MLIIIHQSYIHYENYYHSQKILPKNFNFNHNIPIYYINLHKSIDRKEYMEKQFFKYRIKNYRRIDAIDGSKIVNINKGTIQNIQYENPNSFYYKLNFFKQKYKPFELACVLSHLKTIHEIYLDDCEYAFIMEDDCCFDLVPFWKYDINTIIKQAPPNWEILQLFSLHYSHKKHDFQNIIPQTSTTCYIINKKGVSNVLNKIYKNDQFIFPKNTNILADDFIYKLIQSYKYSPSLFFPKLQSSTINNNGIFKNFNHILNIIPLFKYYNN